MKIKNKNKIIWLNITRLSNNIYLVLILVVYFIWFHCDLSFLFYMFRSLILTNSKSHLFTVWYNSASNIIIVTEGLLMYINYIEYILVVEYFITLRQICVEICYKILCIVMHINYKSSQEWIIFWYL